MDGRVEASSGGVMPGANGFGYFPRKESNPRRGTARKKAWMSGSKVAGSQSERTEVHMTRNLDHQNGHIFGIRYIESAQNKAISGMPTFMKSVKR